MYPLPDLDAIPCEPAAAPLLLAPEPPAPAALPGWLDTGRTPKTPLDAVMSHPAEEITAALAATGTADLQPLLEHLAWERPEAVS